MPDVQLHDIRLHYRAIGTGPTLVLIHGLGSSGADWAFQVRDLAAHFHLVLPDLRGCGDSEKPRTRYTIRQFAQDLWGLLDAIGEHDVGLIGFSLGGAVALEMALQRPQSVSRILTINSLPSYRINSWQKVLEVYGQMLAVRTLGLKRVSKAVGARLFPDPHQDAMRQRVIDVVSGLPLKPYLNAARALAGWCALKRLRALQKPLPLLMLAAENDYTPLAEKQLWAAHIGAPIKVVHGSRHGTPFDSILACNHVIAQYFSGEAVDTLGELHVDRPDQVPRAPPVPLA